MALVVLLCRCERCQTDFEAVPRKTMLSMATMEGKETNEPEYSIDCPTCFRGYFGDIKGGFWSDRELTIIGRAVVDPFKSNVALAEE